MTVTVSLGVAILGLILAILPETTNRLPQLQTIQTRLGKHAVWVFNVVGTIGSLLFFFAAINAFLIYSDARIDFSQGIRFDERESLLLFGAVRLRYYGIIIVIALLISANIGVRLATADGRDPEHLWGALTWAIVPGIIGARMWFVTFPPIASVREGYDSMWLYTNFFDLNNGGIAIWSGGLSIFGAVIGGALGIYAYGRRHRLIMSAWWDIIAVVMPLAQAIGRWANYINQELYGAVTTLPWGIPIDNVNRVFPYKSTVDYPLDTTLFHPIFLYESLWSLAAFIGLLYLFLRRRDSFIPGDIALLYFVQYSVIRFLLEFLRVDVTQVGGYNLSQIVTVAMFILAGGILLMRRRSTGASVKRKDLVDRPRANAKASVVSE